MRRRAFSAFAAFVAFSIGACRSPVVPELAAPDALTLYAIDPGRAPEGTTATFQGHAITKIVTVEDPVRRAAIVDAIDRSIREGDLQRKCFNPRHGVRATKAGVVRDLVICFECRNVSIVGEAEMRSISMSAAETLDEALAH